MASTASFSPRINITNSSAPAPEPTPESTGEITWLSDNIQALGDGEDFIVEIDYDLSLFQSLFLNDKELVLGEDYYLEEGSTIITVKGSYAKNLATGDYSLVAKYSDGKEFTTSLAISENPEELEGSILVPDTGGISAQAFGATIGRNMPFIFSGLLIIIVSFFAIRKYLLPRLKARSYTHSTFRTTTSFRPNQKNTNRSLANSLSSIKNHFSKKTISLSRSSKTGLNLESHKLITAVAGIAVVAGGAYFCLNTFTSNTNEETAFAAPTNEDTLSLSTSSGNFTKDVDLANGNVFVSTSQTVTVNDATVHGYKLFISTDNPKYNDLSINGSISANARILPTSNSFANPDTLEADSYGFAIANSTFGTNYTPSSTSKWAGIPVLGSEIAIKETTTATPANDSTTIYYGFNLTDNLPDGSYYGTNNSAVTYKAIATVLPTYTVNYYCNGGSGSVTSQTADIGAPVTISASTGCERNNYTFKHWNTIANNSGTSYNAGASYTGNQNINLYAIWEKTTPTPTPDPENPEEPEPTYYSFILNYNANGGSNAPASDSDYITDNSTSFTISSIKPTRTDYEFRGWCTIQPSGENCSNGTTSGTTYQAGNTVPFNIPDGESSQIITLYALWHYVEPDRVIGVEIRDKNDSPIESKVISYNNDSHTIKLNAVVNGTPNAVDKGVNWQSGNTKTATVNEKGEVTIVNAGKATITAQSVYDSNKKDTFTITVWKKVIIILGASQLRQINGSAKDGYANVKSYTSSTSGTQYTTTQNNQYNTKLSGPKSLDDTLNFIYYSGHGYQFETAQNWTADAGPNKVENQPPYSGWSFAKKIINHHKYAKDYVDLYVYFTISGNDTKHYSCEEIEKNASKIAYIKNKETGAITRTIILPTISEQIKRYNDVIAEFGDAGYKIHGYVTSQHPMKASDGDSKTYVKNNNANYCTAKYRSNFKYYTVNKKYSSYITNKYKYISYVDTFSQIVDTSLDKTKWSFKSNWSSYKTVDGIHWNVDTASKYFKFWMGLNKSL
ncbi:InlB B-repeat-containing protein [Candidatus Saccharibacteria bacterium]|nr:InlB B-repeat-containing protein [Candidatus Saccharibacteria bacterium]